MIHSNFKKFKVEKGSSHLKKKEKFVNPHGTPYSIGTRYKQLKNFKNYNYALLKKKKGEHAWQITLYTLKKL